MGVVGSAIAIVALLGAPFRATDPGVGYDRRIIAYHAVQSALLSLTFLALSVVLFHASYEEMWRDGFGPISWLLVAVVFLKIAVVNPWIARTCFRREGHVPEFDIRPFGRFARVIRDAWFPEHLEGHANTYYFKGTRPFVGAGTEISSWTVVVDTSVPASGVENTVGRNRPTEDLKDADLYDAILKATAKLGLDGVRTSWRTFVNGLHADREKRRNGTAFGQPPQELSPDRTAALDHAGTRGRKYLVLESRNDQQDLCVSQFIRFQKEGKLLFCEFASYLLAPGVRHLYVLDRVLNIGGVAFAFTGILLFLAAAAGALIAFPVAESLMFLESPELGALDDYVYFITQYGLDYGLLAHAVVAYATVFVAAVLLWRGLRFAATSLGIVLGISRQFGIAFSYRERFTSRGELDYYVQQEAIRFLKVQEKLLINVIHDALKARGIDASDFKESVTAYINQGVINSGNISGNVATSVKSFVFRRPAVSVVSRSQRGKGHG